MSINVSEVIWTVICFFALLFILKKFLFGPLISFMDERQTRIDAGKAANREAEESKQKNAAALEESWKTRNEEAKNLLAQAKTAAEAGRAKTVAQAHADAHEAEKAARSNIQTEREDTLAQAEKKMPELVDALADQLLQNAVKKQ